MSIPKEKFSCTENTEDGGTHLWLNNEDNEPSIHVLGQWEGNYRKELVVCLDAKQLQDFKRQVAAL